MCESAHLVHHHGHNKKATYHKKKHKVKSHANLKHLMARNSKEGHQMLLPFEEMTHKERMTQIPSGKTNGNFLELLFVWI